MSRTEDLSDARRAWSRISKYKLDAHRTATLIGAAWTYAEARRLRYAHSKAHRGEADKAARETIKDLAAQCERLERSIRQALRDPVTRHWLLATIPSPDDDRVPALPNLLKRAAGAMRKIPPDQSQASIFLRMKTDALKEMVQVVAPSDANVPWTNLAEIVNLMVPDDSYVVAKDLEADYRRSHPRAGK